MYSAYFQTGIERNYYRNGTFHIVPLGGSRLSFFHRRCPTAGFRTYIITGISELPGRVLIKEMLGNVFHMEFD